MTSSALNPYAAPASQGVRAAPEVGAPATLGQRFVTYAIDSVAMLGIWPAVLMALLVFADDPEVAMQQAENGSGAAVTAMGMFLYYVPLEYFTGRTLGKLIAGTRVVSTADGSDGRLRFGQTLYRTLLRLIPFEPISLLIRGGDGWHDTGSGTMVVKTRGPSAAGS